MSKIVFFNIPAFGHTNPTLGVVRELVSRGHKVWYYSYEPMQKMIEEAGAEFVPCDMYTRGIEPGRREGARAGSDLALSVRILADTALALWPAMLCDMKQLEPDCIVADSMAVWGKAAALKLGIPFVSSTTTFAFNKYSSKIMGHGFKELLAMLFSMPKVNKQIKRLQKHGYPVKNVLDILQNDNDTHTIVYTSKEFQPCSDTFSDRYIFAGPSIRPVSEEVHKTKDRLVYISMGTVNNNRSFFYKQCIAAFADTEYQAILSVGDLTDILQLGELPCNISVHKKVDQIGVLKKADVFFSHCGMNSVNESLYFGVPLVMCPQTPEQKGVAKRVEQLGAGVLLKSMEPSTVLEAAGRLMKEKSYKENAEAISEKFKRCSGAKGAADKILSLCCG